MAVACYDVYIETDFPDQSDAQLSLVKFPAMRSQFDEPNDLLELSIREKSLNLKLDVALDTRASSYCQERAHILAGKSVAKTFSGSKVDKNSFTSTKTPVEDGQLFVCKVVNERLVCRPLNTILAMRSDLSHFDVKDEPDVKEEVRPVSVRFAGPDRQHSRPTAGPARAQVNQAANDESLDEYRTINYRNMLTREAANQRRGLFGQHEPEVKPDPDAEPVDKKPPVMFTADIKPKLERMDADDIYSSEPGSRAPESAAKIGQVKERVKECLLRAKIVSLEEVYNYLSGFGYGPVCRDETLTPSNKDILDALNDYGILVQGNWAVKSELLYGDSSERDCTDVTGISINLFIAARDYLLWLFTQERLVNRLEYARRVRMPDGDVRQLFEQLATFEPAARRWELKLPTDGKFLEKFPEIVQRQATLWKVRRANKLSIFNA